MNIKQAKQKAKEVQILWPEHNFKDLAVDVDKCIHLFTEEPIVNESHWDIANDDDEIHPIGQYTGKKHWSETLTSLKVELKISKDDFLVLYDNALEYAVLKNQCEIVETIQECYRKVMKDE